MGALVTTRRMNRYLKRLETIERWMVALQAKDQNNLHMADGTSLHEQRNSLVEVIHSLREEMDPFYNRRTERKG